MAWLWAALMPHPPVLVPAVGHGREKEAEPTLSGVEHLCAALRPVHERATPSWLLLLSPHAPYVSGGLFVNSASRLHGSLARFGAPSAAITAKSPSKALEDLKSLLQRAGIPASFGASENITQDHSSIVPLCLLAPCFPDGELPPLIIANPSGLTPEQAFALGKALGQADWDDHPALLASGDLSHRLKEDGPYGFNPAGPIFDRAVVAALEGGKPDPLLRLSPSTREDAGECGLRPVLCLLGLSSGPLKIFSYEGPFGIGYCTALWLPDEQTQQDSSKNTHSAIPAPHPYPTLARKTIERYLNSGHEPNHAERAALPNDLTGDPSVWSPRKGCFVSIKKKDGALRGCIGTFMPTQKNIGEEIIANAISAAVHDPRFPPLQPGELDNIRISVDVLNEPERVVSGMELNPKVYGVIVAKEGRRGLLLPDLEGVDRVAQQLAIAAQKAEIRNLEGAEIYRFTVSRYKERE